MALSEIFIRYAPAHDFLRLSFPARENIVKDAAPIFIFSSDDDLNPTSFVPILGYNEDDQRFTGEIIAIEINDFTANFKRLRSALAKRIAKATPGRDFEVRGMVFELADVDPRALDEDILPDIFAKALVINLLAILDDFYWRAMDYQKTGVVPPGVDGLEIDDCPIVESKEMLLATAG